jgi:hypothetical protein
MSEQKDAVNCLLATKIKWEAGSAASDPYTVASKYRRKDIISLLQEKKVPGSTRYQIDQVSFTLSSRITAKDMYSGLALEFREPLLCSGFKAGFDTKLWPTRILIRENEDAYYQFWDRSSLAYAGIFKDFTLRESTFGPSVTFTASLMGGYSFGNRFEGSYKGPEKKVRIIPAATFRVNVSKLSFSAGLEYSNTGYYRPWPVWLRLGLSWTSFFDDVRMRLKPPKWY